MIGIDVARALAVIGMIIVNFKIVFGDNGIGWIKSLASVFDGRAAATFVVLAGVGLALMTNSAIASNDPKQLGIVRNRIIKRALFLFVVGISYLPIWTADILHFYGIYMAITIVVLSHKKKTILAFAIAFIIAFPILMTLWDYEVGWNFETLDYHGFWTIKGFMRNLFFNGFHPVVPWTAFMLFGYWFGKLNLQNDKLVKKIFWISTATFTAIQITSQLAISFLSEGNAKTAKELVEIIGTHPMPPLPMYMLNGVSIAFAIISACIIIAKQFENNAIINALNKTGQLALTFYVAHVVIGMGIVELLHPFKMGSYSIGFSVAYALVFSFLCLVFAVIWKKFYSFGPLEWIMRKVTH